MLFEANEIGQAFVEGGSFNAEASCCGKDEGGEDTVLDLAHSFPVHSLGLFVSSEGGLEAHRTVARCVWVKDPYIKKSILRAVPESSRPDVKASTIFGVGCSVVKDFS